ncbi:TPA: MBOAT family protein, partial [Burkholderia multivorans]|nr:MBOAT family protein [Burkholderia multivorans]HEM7870468.1 MBOAT family protein [Burkholderia multivorans]HEM7905817.1 MBOAT family protein [Burkholderia multivorans]HEM8537797.1 MBOAT family protein [Burkholderia multivorans]
TFKAISYLIEVYWENIHAERDAIKVALYVSFFPQILSGPIQRPHTFFEQLAEPTALRPTAEALARALPLLLLGAFEKAVLADRIGPLVSALDQHGTQSSLAALFADYGYTLQLFADFSGLTHIAIGLGVLFGITGPANFDKPFSAKSITDFWRRWHASLTTWLGDYLFLPLRMALRGLGVTGLQLSLMINMVLIGVWHGFKPTYLVFGVYHGLLLIASTIMQPRILAFAKRHARFNKVHRFVAPVITFHLVVLGQVFFRAPDLGFAWQNLSAIARATGPGLSIFHSIDADVWRVGLIAAVISLGLGCGLLQRIAAAFSTRFGSNEAARWATLGALVLFVVLAASKTGGQFMYARF